MADAIKARLTGFTHGMERHGAKVVPHDADTMRSIAALSANGITGATLTSRNGSAEFAVVDGVKVYKQCERDAMDFAIRRKPIPAHMIYEYGVPYNPPEQMASPSPALAQNEIDNLLAQVAPAGVAKVAASQQSSSGSSEPDVVAKLGAELAAQKKLNADLAEKLKILGAELAAVKLMAPTVSENTVTIEIPGFGAIALIVDYLHEQGNALVLGTLRSKKRAQAVPKPQDGATSVRFAATIHDKHYELVAFSDLRFPVGDLDVQAFIITNTIGQR